jgi:hypothetical protein
MKINIVTTVIVMFISIICFGQTPKTTPKNIITQKVQGTMEVTDGMLNGTKTMLSKAQIFGDIEYLVTEGEAGRKPIIIKAANNKISMIATFVNANFEITITQPLTKNAQGYFLTTGFATKTFKDTGTIGGKTTTKKVTLPNTNQRVGHVTLLR